MCEIIGLGLSVLQNPEKLAQSSPAQITTAIGTLIDKFTALGAVAWNAEKEDELSKSLREMAREMESDDQ